nr:hypothetical protein CFP56_64268 [Quercus suber]
MQAAQLNMGNKEVHMAGNVIKTHPESQASHQETVSQSSNVLNMSASRVSSYFEYFIIWPCAMNGNITMCSLVFAIDLEE